MLASSVIESLEAFGDAVVEFFGEEYLRKPTKQDLRRIMSIKTARGILGCIGSWNWQHWTRKKCPISWEGQ